MPIVGTVCQSILITYSNMALQFKRVADVEQLAPQDVGGHGGRRDGHALDEHYKEKRSHLHGRTQEHIHE
jgi:hypothetical protein